MDDSLNESLKHNGCKNGCTGKIKPNQYPNRGPILISFFLLSTSNRLGQASSILRENSMNNAVLKKIFIKVIGIAGVATLSSSLQAASFDCAKAGNNIEKMIKAIVFL